MSRGPWPEEKGFRYSCRADYRQLVKLGLSSHELRDDAEECEAAAEYLAAENHPLSWVRRAQIRAKVARQVAREVEQEAMKKFERRARRIA